MKLKDYEFNIGDEVINVYGEVGKIIKICKCRKCEERGFYEPIWVKNNDDFENYISFYEAECGFLNFYQIGKYRFNDFDKSDVLHEIASLERELERLKGNLKVIEDIEKGVKEDN